MDHRGFDNPDYPPLFPTKILTHSLGFTKKEKNNPTLSRKESQPTLNIRE
jgi:hypothetical protein